MNSLLRVLFLLGREKSSKVSDLSMTSKKSKVEKILASCLTFLSEDKLLAFAYVKELYMGLLTSLILNLACIPVSITDNSTLSSPDSENNSNPCLFRAAHKHSCYRNYYRKIICIIIWVGHFWVFALSLKRFPWVDTVVSALKAE